MKTPGPAAGSPDDAERQLDTFIAKFEPDLQALIREVRKALRTRFPTANEMAYDNYNFFVIGYGPTERPSDCFISLTGAAKGVGLCFIRGATLDDPAGILLGSGKQTRFIRLPAADALKRPEVDALLVAAVTQCKTPLPSKRRGRLIIRSVSGKQRPRRKAARSESAE